MAGRRTILGLRDDDLQAELRHRALAHAEALRTAAEQLQALRSSCADLARYEQLLREEAERGAAAESMLLTRLAADPSQAEARRRALMEAHQQELKGHRERLERTRTTSARWQAAVVDLRKAIRDLMAPHLHDLRTLGSDKKTSGEEAVHVQSL